MYIQKAWQELEPQNFFFFDNRQTETITLFLAKHADPIVLEELVDTDMFCNYTCLGTTK